MALIASPNRERFSAMRPATATTTTMQITRSVVVRGMPTLPCAPPVSGRFSTATRTISANAMLAMAR